VQGTIDGASVTNVESSGTLGGTGSVRTLNISAGGTLAPGNSSVGLLNAQDLNLAVGGHFQIELGGASAALSDQLNITGSVTLAGDAQIALTGGFTPGIGDKFFVILNDGSDAVDGAFSNADMMNRISIANATFFVNYSDNFPDGGEGNDVSLTMVSIPEPSAALALLGGAGALLRRRRRSGS
jgi:hypothetical protein